MSFLLEICEEIKNLDCPINTSFIWGGDFNFVFDADLEAIGGNPKLKVRSIETIQEIMLDLDLCDIWRPKGSLGVAKRKDEVKFPKYNHV